MSSTVFCYGCGKEIHKTADNCPFCGAKQKKIGYKKSRIVAALLALFLGGIGVHKFYLGAWGWGIIYLIFCWTFIPGILALIEMIRYFILSDKEFNDKVEKSSGAFAFIW